MQYWLVKQEPEDFSWADLLREKAVTWDGVRNYQARNNLRAMLLGDKVLFYHSVSDKRVMGVAKVGREAFPDPSASEADRDRWSAVELEPLASLPTPVSLAQIKAEAGLSEIALVRHSRLSVMPLTEEAFLLILKMGGWNDNKETIDS